MTNLISGKEAKLAWANGENVEFYSEDLDKWFSLNDDVFLSDVFDTRKLRLKPRTITINGVAVPEGFVLVPKTNSDKGIESMAMRYRHDFPLLDADYQEAIKAQMRQLYEEAVGLGFYSHKVQESGND